MSVTVHHGDSREVLKTLADASIDAVVCDPPYALVSIDKRFGKPGSAPAKSEGASGVYARASAGFMGQQWDTGETAFAVEFWAEVFRVLKPGGHVIAFSGTRTYHRLACAIEDAGFEIRDMVAWLYGSGFPKSHDVSKGIDKARKDNADWEAVGKWLRAQRERADLKQKEVAALWPSATGGLTGCVANWELGLSCPKWDQWGQLKARIGFTDDMDAEVWRLNGRKGQPGDAWDVIETRDAGAATGGVYGTFAQRVEIVRHSAIAEQWQGWGTALKPALEPVVLARKPLDGTVAANVLEHGTGALNIDATRIHSDDAQGGEYKVTRLKPGATLDKTGGNWRPEEGGVEYVGNMKPGRWPANIVHDGSDEVVEAFPDAPRQQRPVTGEERFHRTVNAYGDFGATRDGFEPRGDAGSAARFFYTAKADAEDRHGSKHPTVKPISLMAWLCRLITPPGGVILDPFAGTGTTGIAAMREGFDCILIEREEQYVADIHRRLAWARGEGRLTKLEQARSIDEGKASGADLPLFGGEAA